MKNTLKLLLLSGICFTLLLSAQAQKTAGTDVKTVDAKGAGATREDALNDALRNAVGMVAGVQLQAETQVENLELVSDAIQTRVNGYIAGYDVTSEKNDAGLLTLGVKARVSTAPLKADAQYLARAVGGIRFLVLYDEREFKKDDKALADFATERMNQYLSGKKYRYIEKSVFDRLRTEASNALQDSDTSDLSYVQQLGVKSGGQFIIMLKSIRRETRENGAFGTKQETRTVIEAKAYDNCTAEGLGTVVLEGTWKSSYNGSDGDFRTGLQETIMQQSDKLLEVFNTYVADWVNNGTPFELRFMGSGGYRDLRDLRKRLQADKSFGGQMELTGAEGYMALNCTFRNKPEDLADRVLSIADDIPGLKGQRMDVKLIYGRQITFSPGAGGTPPPKSGAYSKQAAASKANRKKAK